MPLKIVAKKWKTLTIKNQNLYLIITIIRKRKERKNGQTEINKLCKQDYAMNDEEAINFLQAHLLK